MKEEIFDSLVAAESPGLKSRTIAGYSIIAGEAVPGFFPLRQFCGWVGCSLQHAYNEARSGRLIITKNGNMSGVTGPNAISYRNALPDAQFCRKAA